MVLVPEPMGNKQFFGLCAFTRSWEGLKLCQNVARVSPGGVKGLDLGLGMFTYLAPCMVSVASSPCSDPPKLCVCLLLQDLLQSCSRGVEEESGRLVL